MTTSNIKQVLTKAYLSFLEELSDDTKPDVEDKLKISVLDLFVTQRTTDKAKSELGKDFDKALRQFFQTFYLPKKDVVDFKRLKTSVYPREINILRHLGKDRLAYIKLLISIADTIEEKRSGLLFGEVS